MKKQGIPFMLFMLMLLSACSPKEKGNHYNIGATEWYIKFPKTYVSFANIPDTLERTLICDPETKEKTIVLLKLQKKDTLWVDPVPNSLYVFLVPKEIMNKKRQDCVEQMIQSYSMMNESGRRMTYKHKSREITIGDIDFIELENTFLDSTGYFSHGDVQYIGIVDNYAMQIQLSYNDVEERIRLQNLILKSKFE